MSVLGNSIVSTQSSCRLRPMRWTDLPKIVQIERLSYPFPWTWQLFEDCLANAYYCWVLEQSFRISAYAVWSLALDEAHLLNLCVHPDERRQGMAAWMLGELCQYASHQGGKTLFLEVRPSNQEAIRLYQHSGFCEVGLRRNYYPAKHDREDALIMAKSLELL